MELLAGDPAAAETSLRAGFDALERMGEKAFLSTTAAFLARAVFAQGRIDEADELAQLSASLTAPGDLLTQLLWRGVRAGYWRRADGSTRPRRSHARRCHSRVRPTSSSSTATPSSTSALILRQGARARRRGSDGRRLGGLASS